MTSQSNSHKRTAVHKLINPTKQVKAILSAKAGKLSKKSKTHKKTEEKPKKTEKTQNSLSGPSRGSTSKIINKRQPSPSNKENLSCLLSKLPLGKTHEKSQTRHLSQNTYRAGIQKEKFSALPANDKKFKLKQKICRGVENGRNKAGTNQRDVRDPARTPEQVRAEGLKKKTISGEKGKQPEGGKSIKWSSFDDLKKTLYTDEDAYKGSMDYHQKPSASSFVSEMNQDLLQVGKFGFLNMDGQDEIASDKGFKSSARMLQVNRSLSGKSTTSGQELKGCKAEPKAPRLTLVGLESPGSFNFSISSCSASEDCTDGCKSEASVEPGHVESLR